MNLCERSSASTKYEHAHVDTWCIEHPRAMPTPSQNATLLPCYLATRTCLRDRYCTLDPKFQSVMCIKLVWVCTMTITEWYH